MDVLEARIARLEQMVKERLQLPTFDSSGAASGLVEDLQGSSSVTITKSGRHGILTSSGGSGSGAPVGSPFITYQTDATLTAERVLTAGDGITFTPATATVAQSARVKETYISFGSMPTGYTV